MCVHDVCTCACACVHMWVHVCACVFVFVCMCVHVQACATELTSNVGMHADIEVVSSQSTTNKDNFQFMSAFLHGFYDMFTPILNM